jgi:dephospho-CoA kinase
MIKYAIVGNIASGKSEMERVLDKKGYVVLDTDLMAHDILTDKPDVPKAFSDYDVFEYGRLSRDKLGKLVFSDPELKTKLEDIVHPLIKEELESAFNVYSGEDVLFVSVPLLFEVGWENLFDKIVFIKSDDVIRLNRLIERNGYSKEYAQTRIDSQSAQEGKAKKADYVIENNGSKEEFIAKIEEFIATISV